MSRSISIESQTIKNKYYRRVIQTTDQMQLVFMNLLPGENIPKEVHPHTTQFIRVEQGSGYAVINGVRSLLSDGRSIIIPAGKHHEIVAGRKGLKLYTLYSPPEHSPNTKQINK